MDKYTFLRFDLFDGEGGESGSSDSGLGAEARAFAQSIGMEWNEAEVSSNGNEASPSEVGSHEEANPQQEFAELIGKGGKYHDAYGQAVSQAINQRFRNQSDLQAKIDSYDDIMSPLFERYGLAQGDVEGLRNSLQGDESLFVQAAEEEGLSVEQYREQLRLKADAERGRQLLAEYKNQQERNAKFADWERQADELRQAFPNFDLGQELKSEQFGRMLDSGISVQDAFVAMHAEDILSGINEETTRSTKQNVLDNIRSRQARPQENASRSNPATVRTFDPSAITDADMDDIIKKALDGSSFNPYI
jgi:hypothetical protein